jgi:hypothetical protein
MIALAAGIVARGAVLECVWTEPAQVAQETLREVVEAAS